MRAPTILRHFVIQSPKLRLIDPPVGSRMCRGVRILSLIHETISSPFLCCTAHAPTTLNNQDQYAAITSSSRSLVMNEFSMSADATGCPCWLKYTLRRIPPRRDYSVRPDDRRHLTLSSMRMLIIAWRKERAFSRECIS